MAIRTGDLGREKRSMDETQAVINRGNENSINRWSLVLVDDPRLTVNSLSMDARSLLTGPYGLHREDGGQQNFNS